MSPLFIVYKVDQDPVAPPRGECPRCAPKDPPEGYYLLRAEAVRRRFGFDLCVHLARAVAKQEEKRHAKR